MMESIKELREICYKDSKAKRPLYMEMFTMKISIYVTKLLLYTPISADHVTISMILLVAIGSALMAFGSLKFLLIGILLVHFTVVLDNVNGEVARYRKEGSMTGTFLEQLYHEIAPPLIFFFLSFGVFMETGYSSVLIFGMLCAIFSKSVVLPAIDAAIVKNALRDAENGRIKEKMKKYISVVGKADLKGGGTKSGRKLYDIYDYIREFWGAPFSIAHINLIILLEIVNFYYGFWPRYFLVYWYIAAYGILSVIIQIISFIVHYRGKTVYHYYVSIFGEKK